MLIEFDKSSRTALGGYDMQSGSHLRDGASRNSIPLRAVSSRLLVPVAPSRVEENDGASILSRCKSALLDIAAIASAILLIAATGIGFTVAIYLLLFASF